MLIYCVKLDHALYSINYGNIKHVPYLSTFLLVVLLLPEACPALPVLLAEERRELSGAG